MRQKWPPDLGARSHPNRRGTCATAGDEGTPPSQPPAPRAPPLFPDASCVHPRACHNPLGPGRCASEACRNAARVAPSAATLRRSCAAFGRPLLLLLLFRRFDAVAGAFEAVAPSPTPSALCVAVKLVPSSATSAPAPPLPSAAAPSVAHSFACGDGMCTRVTTVPCCGFAGAVYSSGARSWALWGC